jgi:hypothetical protein
MNTKTCKKCGIEKDYSSFYQHKETADGLLHICKDCKKEYAKWYASTESGKEVQRKRNAKPERIKKNIEYTKRWRKSNPDKALAHSRLWRAIGRGEIVIPETCQSCGKKGSVHGHHHDYSKPLDVEWLCPACHGKKNPHYRELTF